MTDVQAPDGSIIRFPAGTSERAIVAFMSERYPAPAKKGRSVTIGDDMSETDIRAALDGLASGRRTPAPSGRRRIPGEGPSLPRLDEPSDPQARLARQRRGIGEMGRGLAAPVELYPSELSTGSLLDLVPESESAVEYLGDLLGGGSRSTPADRKARAGRSILDRLADTGAMAWSAPVRLATRGEHGLGDLLGLVSPALGSMADRGEARFAEHNAGALDSLLGLGEVSMGLPGAASVSSMGTMGRVPVRRPPSSRLRPDMPREFDAAPVDDFRAPPPDDMLAANEALPYDPSREIAGVFGVDRDRPHLRHRYPVDGVGGERLNRLASLWGVYRVPEEGVGERIRAETIGRDVVRSMGERFGGDSAPARASPADRSLVARGDDLRRPRFATEPSPVPLDDFRAPPGTKAGPFETTLYQIAGVPPTRAPRDRLWDMSPGEAMSELNSVLAAVEGMTPADRLARLSEKTPRTARDRLADYTPPSVLADALKGGLAGLGVGGAAMAQGMDPLISLGLGGALGAGLGAMEGGARKALAPKKAAARGLVDTYDRAVAEVRPAPDIPGGVVNAKEELAAIAAELEKLELEELELSGYATEKPGGKLIFSDGGMLARYKRLAARARKLMLRREQLLRRPVEMPVAPEPRAPGPTPEPRPTDFDPADPRLYDLSRKSSPESFVSILQHAPASETNRVIGMLGLPAIDEQTVLTAAQLLTGKSWAEFRRPGVSPRELALEAIRRHVSDRQARTIEATAEERGSPPSSAPRGPSPRLDTDDTRSPERRARLTERLKTLDRRLRASNDPEERAQLQRQITTLSEQLRRLQADVDRRGLMPERGGDGKFQRKTGLNRRLDAVIDQIPERPGSREEVDAVLEQLRSSREAIRRWAENLEQRLPEGRYEPEELARLEKLRRWGVVE